MSPATPASAVLRDFLAAQDEKAAMRDMQTLLEQAMPVVQRVLAGRAGVAGVRHTGEQWDLEGVASHAKERLVARLRNLREQPGQNAIEDFEGYVAVTARTCWAEHLREKFPQRTMLRNQLRYLMDEQAGRLGLVLVRGADGEMAAALSRRGEKAALTGGALLALLEKLEATGGWDGVELKDAVPRILEAADAPIALEALVSLLATLQGISDRCESLDDPDAMQRSGPERTAAGGPVSDAVWREYLGWLWARLLELPMRHRTAMMLRMDELREMALAGVADLRAMAAALEMDPLQFAEIWKDIPLDDLRIAARLGASRQQVINMRSSAREKISRRLPEIMENWSVAA